MKKLALILSLAVLPSICLMQAQAPRGKIKRDIVVPKGKTYVVLNARGKETARYTAGQVMAKSGNCVQIPCPKDFDPGITCWDCHTQSVQPSGQPPARQ